MDNIDLSANFNRALFLSASFSLEKKEWILLLRYFYPQHTIFSDALSTYLACLKQITLSLNYMVWTTHDLCQRILHLSQLPIILVCGLSVPPPGVLPPLHTVEQSTEITFLLLCTYPHFTQHGLNTMSSLTSVDPSLPTGQKRLVQDAGASLGILGPVHYLPYLCICVFENCAVFV